MNLSCYGKFELIKYISIKENYSNRFVIISEKKKFMKCFLALRKKKKWLWN